MHVQHATLSIQGGFCSPARLDPPPPSIAACPNDAHQKKCVSNTPEPSAVSAGPHASATTTGRFHPSAATARSCTRRELKRIPRRFHQIALPIRFCRRPHIHVVRFRWPGFLPTHFRCLIKRQDRKSVV